MKVVVAIDSFKGSISSEQSAQVISEVLREYYPEVDIEICLIADGGEGMIQSLNRALGGELIDVEVSDPLMRPIKTNYCVINNLALIEMASCSGLTLIAESERNPLYTTTWGVGELITDALNRGCREFVVGIGGSATNDGGVGMLQALGFRFLDANGRPLGTGGAMLEDIAKIDALGADIRLKDSIFRVACDVTNPLCGEQGAAYVYAPQKGADEQMVQRLDEGLGNFADKIRQLNGVDVLHIVGAGAAGGMGGGMAGLLNATLEQGVIIVLSYLEFDRKIVDADFVITGEGRMDRQTVMGKAPWGILQVAKQQGVSVIGIAGRVEDEEVLRSAGFAHLIEVSPRDISLCQAMRQDVVTENIRRAFGAFLNSFHLEN